MDIINLTPHDVVIISDGEVSLRIPPSGRVAKLPEKDILLGTINGIPIVRKEYGDAVILAREDFLKKKADAPADPLPQEQDGVVYVVPMLVGQQLAGTRSDLIGPDFGIGGVRTSDGKISGAVGFIQY